MLKSDHWVITMRTGRTHMHTRHICYMYCVLLIVERVTHLLRILTILATAEIVTYIYIVMMLEHGLRISWPMGHL